MTNYPQRPNDNIARAPQGSAQRGPGGPDASANRAMGENPLSDPGIRMVLAISPQDGSIKPLPADLSFEQQANGSVRVAFPDGSVRELIPGATGEGRMITTLADGTRIQSDLTFGEGQVNLSSISSTGEKTLLSLNENGANIQRVTADGDVSSFIPDSAPELMQSYREAEAFAQAEELRQQEQFQGNQEFGEWNNYGKPADWQPEQNWQPPQGDYLPKPDYAGNNWVDNGNGSWIAPIQPDAFMQPMGYAPPQQFGEWNNYGKPADWQPPQGTWQPPQFDQGLQQPQNWQPPQGNWQPPQFDQGLQQPQNWQPPQGNWQPPQFDQGFQQPQNWQPPQGNWQPPQFDQGFQQPQNWQPPQFDQGFQQPQNWQPPQENWQPPAAFMAMPNTDASGFPFVIADAAAQATSDFSTNFSNGYEVAATDSIQSMEPDGNGDVQNPEQPPAQY